MQLTLAPPRCSISAWKIIRKISSNLQNALIARKPVTNICSRCVGHMASNARNVEIQQLGQPLGMNTVAVNATYKRQLLQGPFFTGPVNLCSYGSKRCGV